MIISIKNHERALNLGLSYPGQTKQSTINNQWSRRGIAQLYEGEGEEREWKAKRKLEKLKAKLNGKAALAEQMVSAFLPKALHTHRNHHKEGERDGEMMG